MQIQAEVSKLLELKKQLGSDADGASGKFVLKCPKVAAIFYLVERGGK